MNASRSAADAASSDPSTGREPLGPALRRAWVGYQRRLDREMAAAGFDDRRFPNGRVLRLCRGTGVTIADVGRELGITRQGAHKLVGYLREGGYVTVAPSAVSGRERTVTLTATGHEYLAAQRKAARKIERRLRRRLGDDAFAALARLLEELHADSDDRLREYLRSHTIGDR